MDTSSFKIENNDQKSMQNAYPKNQSDRLSLNFMNKPLINNLSCRGTERRDVYGITTEDT